MSRVSGELFHGTLPVDDVNKGYEVEDKLVHADVLLLFRKLESIGSFRGGFPTQEPSAAVGC